MPACQHPAATGGLLLSLCHALRRSKFRITIGHSRSHVLRVAIEVGTGARWRWLAHRVTSSKWTTGQQNWPNPEGPAREIYRGVAPLEGVLEPCGVIFGLEFEEPLLLLCDFALALRCAVERPDEAPVLLSDGVFIEVPSVALDPALPGLVEPVDVPLSGIELGMVEPGVPLGLLVEPEPDPVVLPVLVDWADATVASPKTAMANIVV